MSKSRPRLHAQNGYLPSQRFVVPPKPAGKRGQRIAGHNVLEYIQPEMKEPLTKALSAFEEARLGDALHWFGECAKIDPMNKAVLYFGSEAAQRAYFMLKMADPTPPPAHLNKWRKSAIDLSLALIEAHRDSVVLHNFARFIQDDGNDEGSIPIYEEALRLKRDQVESWGNLGTALLRVGRRKEADTAWSKCVAFDAVNASGNMAQAYIWVRRGEWQRGFQALNQRWADRTFTDSYGRKDLNAKGKPWTGQPLKSTDTLLLHGEQGLGDHVMFARYIPELQARGYTIAGLETRAALKGWFDACWLGFPVTVRDQDPLPSFTHHVPLMSLPGILGTDDLPKSLAPEVPDGNVQRGTSARLRVGIAWKGTKGNIMDAQRSMPEHELAGLARLDVDWVPLQYDPTGVEALTAQMWLGGTVLPSPFSSVLEMAEVMKTCDHVLTIDSLPAHVAGSLGIPSTVLHRYHREWRWGLDTTETPWYPGQQLVTCLAPDDWAGAIAEAVTHLKQIAPPVNHADEAIGPNGNGLEAPDSTNMIRVVQGRYGEFHVNALDDFVGRSLIEYGEFSKGEGDLFADLIKPDWKVVEVGANIGAHTKQLTQLAHSVTAYEPNPDNAELLRLNAPDAVVIEAAVGRDQGQTTVERPSYRLPGNFGGLHVGRGDHPVPMVTLTEPCDFLKLDVEGMEMEVLEGARSIGTPIIYAEADHASKAEPLLRWLTARGYRTWWHLPKLFVLDNYNQNTANVWPEGIASVNLLAVPENQPLGVDPQRHGLMDSRTTQIKLQA